MFTYSQLLPHLRGGSHVSCAYLGQESWGHCYHRHPCGIKPQPSSGALTPTCTLVTCHPLCCHWQNPRDTGLWKLLLVILSVTERVLCLALRVMLNDLSVNWLFLKDLKARVLPRWSLTPYSLFYHGLYQGISVQVPKSDSWAAYQLCSFGQVAWLLWGSVFSLQNWDKIGPTSRIIVKIRVHL